ncbi:M24 family metallopeptidase [Candidatus Omnitrophota bacterium]
MDYIARQKILLRALGAESLDSFLVRKKQNISYLTGTRGEDAVLFVSHKKSFLVTDSRYKEEYARFSGRYSLKIIDGRGLASTISKISNDRRLRRIGFESEASFYSEYIDLKKKLKNKKLVPVKGAVEKMRILKDIDEIVHIRKACRTGADLMKYAMSVAEPSRKEECVKNMIEAYLAKKGIEKAGFDIIVASGKNASMPHAPVSKKNLKKGEMVIIDLGTRDYGYNSDLTRTVFLGRIDRKYLRIYNIVLDAQKRAIEAIKPGLKANYIDDISRKYISNKGLERYFIHSLGHGIGLETHERPHISMNNKDMLEKNMVITVEPGVYIPGWGGVRIEDTVLITKNGCEVLTKRCRK